MFSIEMNGYNRREVDSHLASLKANQEKLLMSEKLKVLEAERKIMDMSKKVAEAEEKEKSMRKVLQSFKKMQTERNNNIDMLRGEQFKIVYLHLQEFMVELNEKYPGVLVNNSYKKLLRDIQKILEREGTKKDQIGSNAESDAMRMLLSKMQEKRGQDSPKEVRFERTNDFKERPIQIRPVTELQLKEGDGYDSLVDKFLATQPDKEDPRAKQIQSTGFDLKEAITPKEELSEIMKAFDFFTGEDEEN